MMRVSICIATYQRPKGLKRLLDSLANLGFTKSPRPDLEIVVVDNDATGTALPVVKAAEAPFPWPIRYETEHRRGISMARNRAILLAGETEFIAFIDDDAIADPDWLDELLYAQRVYTADVVTGPVLPRFDVQPPAWILRGRFFERARYTSGKSLGYARTGNVLIRWGCLSQLKGDHFDEGFALTGGEDTHLFMRLWQRGAKIVWADAAIVEEDVPFGRQNAKWLLRRAFRGGASFTLCERTIRPFRFWWLLGAIKAFARIGQGSLILFPSLFIERAASIRALMYISHGLGVLFGLLGMRYELYRSGYDGEKLTPHAENM